MKKFKYIYLFSILTLISCSQIAKRFTSPIEEENRLTFKKQQDFTCRNNSTQILFENESASNLAASFLKSNYYKNLNFVEKGLALSIFEMIRKPTKVSPQSHTQIFFIINNEKKYFDITNEKNNLGLPFIYSIETILKSNSKKSLATFFSELDQFLPEDYTVDEDLQSYIVKNKAQIIKFEGLSQLWTKGDEPITHFETYKRPKLKSILNYYYQNKFSDSKNYQMRNLPLDNSENRNFNSISCNFDFNSEIDQIDYKIEKNSEVNGQLSLIENENFFVLLTSSTIENQINLLSNTTFIKHIPQVSSQPICLFNNSNTHNNFFFAATTGRAKSQHLKHIIEYEIYNALTLETTLDVLNFSRHLFLTSPDRILYESKRGRKDQLDYFLSMNFPIYHVEKIGNIVGRFQSPKEKYLIKDTRSEAVISCPK